MKDIEVIKINVAGVAEPAEGERDGAAGVGGGGDVRLLGARPRQGHHLRLAPLARHQGHALPALQDLAVQEDSAGLPAEPGNLRVYNFFYFG